MRYQPLSEFLNLKATEWETIAPKLLNERLKEIGPLTLKETNRDDFGTFIATPQFAPMNASGVTFCKDQNEWLPLSEQFANKYGRPLTRPELRVIHVRDRLYPVEFLEVLITE